MFELEKYEVPSYSFLKNMLSSPAEAVWKKQNPTETSKVQHEGNVFEAHICRTLEGFERINLDERPEPNKTMAAKANKEWFNDLTARLEQQGKTPVDDELWRRAKYAQAQIPLLPDSMKFQVEIQGELGGMKYRGYADGLYENGDILEMKTVHPNLFHSAAKRNYWDMQGAMYLHATGGEKVVYLAVGTSYPCPHRFFHMYKGNEDYLKALKLAEQALEAFYTCKADHNLFCMGPEYWHPLPTETHFNRYIPEWNE